MLSKELLNERRQKLWKHQQYALDFLFERRYRGILSLTMGLGKTAIACQAIAEHSCCTGGDLYIVLGPKATMGHWANEITQWVPEAEVVTRHKGMDAKKLTDAITISRAKSKLTVVVLNYEWFRTESVFAECLKQYWCGVIFDESHRLADRKSLQSKRCKSLAKQIIGLSLCLSGTVFSHSPLSVWHQMSLVNDRLWPNYYAFENYYATHYTIPSVAAKLIKGYRNLDQLAEEFRTMAFVATSEEWQPDLIEPIHLEVPYELDDKNRKVYDDFKRNMVAQMESGVMVADNALVKALRLQEITSGFVRPEDCGAVHELHQLRMKALKKVIDSVPDDRPVVVFYQFEPERDQIRRVAAQCDREFLSICGSTKDGLTDKGKLAGDSNEVVAVQIQAGSEGIDLTRSNHLVFYRKGWRYASYAQAVKRIHRPGQEHCPFVFHIECEDTLDQLIRSSLSSRKDLSAKLLMSHLKGG